jgi:hypothetical protein
VSTSPEAIHALLINNHRKYGRKRRRLHIFGWRGGAGSCTRAYDAEITGERLLISKYKTERERKIETQAGKQHAESSNRDSLHSSWEWMLVVEFTHIRLMRIVGAFNSNQAIKIHCILRGNENVCCGVHWSSHIQKANEKRRSLNFKSSNQDSLHSSWEWECLLWSSHTVHGRLMRNGEAFTSS